MLVFGTSIIFFTQRKMMLLGLDMKRPLYFDAPIQRHLLLALRRGCRVRIWIYLDTSLPRLARRLKRRKIVERRYFYRVSLRSLFSLTILEDTDKSMVRSPISTTRPPRISGFTSFVTFSFLPGPTYCDLETAASRRDRVRPSSCYSVRLGSRPH